VDCTTFVGSGGEGFHCGYYSDDYQYNVKLASENRCTCVKLVPNSVVSLFIEKSAVNFFTDGKLQFRLKTDGFLEELLESKLYPTVSLGKGCELLISNKVKKQTLADIVERKQLKTL